jgi:glycosyltransferase involved in cell wall biosynthesis
LLLYAGRLDPNKGLKELLTAVARLRIDHPRLRLTLLGEGIMHEQLVELARHSKILDIVSFAGVVRSAGVASWMAAANVFCLPSYSEGCPNVIIEALASGRPVVASTVGGIPELITPEHGILVPPRDTERLTTALHKALSTSWDETAIARHFSRGWDQVAREVYQVCAERVDLSINRDLGPLNQTDHLIRVGQQKPLL